MNSMLAKWKSRDFLVVLIFLQFALYATVLLDVPVARQVLGLLYLTFVPGFIIIKLLRFNELNGLETILFSVGLSVAFLMLVGLIINEISPSFGVSKPLSLMPLMIVMNSLILVGGVLVYLRSENVKLFGVENFGLSLLLPLLIVLPVLSVVGAYWVNAYENNLILLIMIVAIALLFAVGIISKKVLPSQLYPIAILVVALALLYHSSLISNYITAFGSDVPVEYFLVRTTQNSAHWSSTILYRGDVLYGRMNAMLSITILPTIYSSLLNMDPTWVFKTLYPVIFSLVPLGLYQVWQPIIGKRYAFISTFLFMAESTFYTEMLGLNRQIIGELFFVLLMLVILKNKMKPLNRMMFFVIFGVALVMSHYALAEIFLFFIFFALVSLVVLKRPSRKITFSMVVLLFVLMFTWYIYTSGAAVFDSFVSFGDYVFNQLGEFFNPASRGMAVLRGLGLEASPSIWNTMSRGFAYLTQALIVFGFVGLISKRTRIQIEKEYLALSLTAMILLGALILVPGLAQTLNMTRFYHVLLFFLAPFCVIGATVVVKLISKREKEFGVSILLLIVLLPYFLFQTGFVYEVTRSDSWSVPLSEYRMDALRLYGFSGYMDEESIFGALWMSKNVYAGQTPIYADPYCRKYVLSTYGMIYRGYVDTLSNTTILASNGTIYLGKLNTVDRVVYSYTSAYLLSTLSSWNSSQLTFDFANLTMVYTNGGSEIYKNSP